MRNIVIGNLNYAWVRELRRQTEGARMLWMDDPDGWLHMASAKDERGFGPLPDYVFFVHWSQHVPRLLTDRTECVNFHCTPLPYGRGGHPIENMIRLGHDETTITAHRMTNVLDGGPIYARRGGISLAGKKEEILRRFIDPVRDMIDEIERTRPVPVRQSGTVTHFRRLSPKTFADFWLRREEDWKE